MAEALYQIARMVDAVLSPTSVRAGTGSIATARPYRVLAWPDYRSRTELMGLFRGYGRWLAGQSDVSLCLLCNEGDDPRLPDVIDAVRRAREEVLGPGAVDGIQFIDDGMTPDSWPDLGAASHAVLTLPSSASGRRRAFARLVSLPAVARAADLSLILSRHRARARSDRWHLPIAPTRHGLPPLEGDPCTPHDLDAIWTGLGYRSEDLVHATVVEMGCGPQLRTAWFQDARIEVIDPQADEFEQFWWNDIHRARRVHPSPLAERLPALEGRARLVVVGDGILAEHDHEAVIAAATSYLGGEGELILRLPKTPRAPRGLRAVRSWIPAGADDRAPFMVWRREGRPLRAPTRWG